MISNQFLQIGQELLSSLPKTERTAPVLGVGACSLFAAPITHHLVPQQSVSIRDIAALLTSDAIREATAKIRATDDPDLRRKLKVDVLPGITPAAILAKRRGDSLLCTSGVISMDLDGVSNAEALKAQLAADTSMPPLLIYTSVSGQGLKVLYRIVLTAEWTFLRWFNFYSQYLSQTYGITPDRACKDLTRLAFLSYDDKPFVAAF